MARSGNYFYSPDSLQWQVDDSEMLKERLIREMVTMMPRKTPPTGPRAYRWEAWLPGGGTKVTGKLVVEDESATEDIIRMRAYQKFQRHVELESASPGTLSCYHVSPKGHRVHVGFFPSSAAGQQGNVYIPTGMRDLERYVAVYIYADKDGQLELDRAEWRPRGPEMDLAILDEIQLMPTETELSGADVGTGECASGCSCPIDGADIAYEGSELKL